MQLNIPTESAVLTIKWNNKNNNDDVMLAAGCKEGQVFIFNVKNGDLAHRLDANDQQ